LLADVALKDGWLTFDDLTHADLDNEGSSTNGRIESAEQHVNNCTLRGLIDGRLAYCLPLLSGMVVSFKKPVYSIVTVSPFFGIGPVPSARTVLVTPMIADVREKLRLADGNVILVGDRAVRWRIRKCCGRESMRKRKEEKYEECREGVLKGMQDACKRRMMSRCFGRWKFTFVCLTEASPNGWP
jgi:hypothetical protein